MAIGINPTVDFAFKRVLGSPEHPAITLHFLNAVLGGDPFVTQVEILNPFLEKDFDEDKLAILDVRATDEHGRWLNIEMQTTVTGEFTINGSCASRGEYPACLDMIADGAVNVDSLITAIAPLAEGDRWFQRLYQKEKGLLKVILEP